MFVVIFFFLTVCHCNYKLFFRKKNMWAVAYFHKLLLKLDNYFFKKWLKNLYPFMLFTYILSLVFHHEITIIPKVLLMIINQHNY